MPTSIYHRLVLLPVIVLLVAFLFQCSKIPSEARVYPVLLLGASLLLVIFLLIYPTNSSPSNQKSTAYKVRQAKNYTITQQEGMSSHDSLKEEKISKSIGMQLFLFCILVLLYMWFIVKISYIVATVLFMVLAFYMLKVRNVYVILFVPLVTTISLYLFFSRVLRVILPQGEWFFIYL